MGMHRHLLFALMLTAPFLAGCIAGGDSQPAETNENTPVWGTEGFTVRSFVQGLEEDISSGLVSARVESLSLEYNQTRVTLVEWRSFTQTTRGCDLVSTMSYEGQGRNGGFLVHKTDEPCPMTLSNRPTVAEAVALVDRAPPAMIQRELLDTRPIFSMELLGYCSHTSDGAQQVHVWNGNGFTEHAGTVRCGGGAGSALTLAVTVPTASSERANPSQFVILEQVPVDTPDPDPDEDADEDQSEA